MDEGMNQLLSKQELELLFPNQIQRDIFIKIINQLVEYVTEQTTIKGWKLTLC